MLRYTHYKHAKKNPYELNDIAYTLKKLHRLKVICTIQTISMSHILSQELMEDRDLLQRKVDEQLQQIAELKLSMDGLKVASRDEPDHVTVHNDVIAAVNEEVCVMDGVV